ncbi:MAG: energy transducer TonB, partial [Clostridia bacterium]|nr:energy transducer TonB [Clostridia bacterium]
MNRGKATCAILKQIRRDIAEKNDIALTISECTSQGNCSGTCPKCEAEVRLLEKALAEKKRRGIQTAVAGISAGLLAASLVSCTPVGAEDNHQDPG